jgi:hypothetical protein
MLGLTLLFNSCGQLDDFTFSSSGTYRVNALVNDKALSECSLIAETDEIYPYFAASVANDPDVTGLMIYLQSPSGKTAGSRVQYLLKSAEPMAAGQSGEESPEPDTIVTLRRLDNKLPRFHLPPGLEPGFYTMVFQVLGAQQVLHRSDQAVYYLGSAAFNLANIRCYLPGVSGNARESSGTQGPSNLVAPGITVMLDTRINADPQMDPYIVWYNGKKRISEGNYSGGAGIILWKAPEQTGFYTIRVEVFPAKPDQQIAGRSKEIVLPVSSRAENRGYFYRQQGAISQWYTFWGNLGDFRAPTATEKSLIPGGTRPIRWSPADGLYGLSIGPEEIYLLPEFAFDFSGGAGRGSFLFRFKPLSPGIVFQAFFKNGNSSAEGLRMTLLNQEDSCSLLLESGGRGSETRPIKKSWTEGFMAVTLDFSTDGHLFTAVLNMEDQPEPVEITLSEALDGGGSLQFGAESAGPENTVIAPAENAGTPPPEGAETTEEDAGTAPPETGGIAGEIALDTSGVTAIIDEFAIIDSSGPLLSGAPPER